MAGDWRISAEERARYDTYFQQCGPVQGYLSGEQAREFFVKSTLPGDILRRIWDLADVTGDGRLDKREFAIACCLISSQVQKKGPLPPTLPPSLLSDSNTTMNGIPPAATAPLSINASGASTLPTSQPTGHILKTAGPANPSLIQLTPAIRSKYLQQFHALVDVTKTNGFMTGLQAKNILVQTGLSNILLHQIWNLADHDKDGRLTANEFIIAMHCCDIARTGQPLPSQLPEEWLSTNVPERDRLNSSGSKSAETPTFANLNQQLKEQFPQENPTTEQERKSIMATYEEKRLKNYEDGQRELERRRQLLREQEEREQREREERERKRELELQKQREEQERKKQMEIERQLEKQRQIEQQKEEERKKLYEQREAARKEMERKSRLEWERQRMQELSTQKSRLLEQINDLKSREKAFELELESMNDTMETSQQKINQIETNIHTIEQSITELQNGIITEKNQFETIEQQKKDLTVQLNQLQSERDSLDLYAKELSQSKEFNNGNREADQMKYLQGQIDLMAQETIQTDEEITTITNQCKEYQDQMEQLRVQFEQLEQEAKDKKPPSKVTSPTNPPEEFANFEQFNANVISDETNDQPSDVTSALPTDATVTATSPTTVDADPFQTVDPFASQPGADTTASNTDWFQPTNTEKPSTTVDPFLPKPETVEDQPAAVDPFLPKLESVENPPVVAAGASPRVKKAAPKANPNPNNTSKEPSAPTADPWGSSTNTTNHGNDWAQFDKNNTNSPFGTTSEWPQTTTTVSNGNTSNDIIQYRALYDYTAERPDELSISTGDIIIVDPSKQQDEHWLFGQIGNDKQGFFPVAYTEHITSTPAKPAVDTTSQLPSGSWVLTLADHQGKTVDKHLSFQKGEFIHVREQKDTIWYSGELNGKIGWFPRNYVRPATEHELENKKSSTKDTPADETSVPTPNQPSNENDNDIYEAIYPYEATDASDLSFDIGEHIHVIKRDGDWWTGRIGDRTGTFPYNYVQKIENHLQTAIAIKSYQSTEENHLSFEQGQIIFLTKTDENGFYQGEIRVPDQPVRAGLFPADYVQIQTSVLPTPHEPPAEHPRCQAIFPYEAQQDDELSFPADAILEILEQANTNGWFKARLGHQIGLIPSTYVQVIDNHNQCKF